MGRVRLLHGKHASGLVRWERNEFCLCFGGVWLRLSWLRVLQPLFTPSGISVFWTILVYGLETALWPFTPLQPRLLWDSEALLKFPSLVLVCGGAGFLASAGLDEISAVLWTACSLRLLPLGGLPCSLSHSSFLCSLALSLPLFLPLLLFQQSGS